MLYTIKGNKPNLGNQSCEKPILQKTNLDLIVENMWQKLSQKLQTPSK